MREAIIDNLKPSKASPVWIVPLIAVVFGGWLLIDSYLSQGPLVEVRFADAEGIKAGETSVKRLSVELGTVTEVYLNENFNDVTAIIQFDPGSAPLLREDSQFWVVKPRVGAGGISGLSTILSGAYIELTPGEGPIGRRKYAGLASAPITPVTTPGKRIRLVAQGNNTLFAGNPILYHGHQVGRLESTNLSIEDGNTYYDLFIEAPFDDLITSNTKFWNASGIAFDASADGITVRTGSLEALLSGGIAFGLMEGAELGSSVAEGTQFQLYASYSSIPEQNFEHGTQYLLLFDSSVRGLSAGAPVEYRGVRFGTVLDVSFDLVDQARSFSSATGGLVPVLIRLDPGRVFDDTVGSKKELEKIVGQAVTNGLRASLSSGNLLTGSLYVALDFFADAAPTELTVINGQTVFPTVNSGFAQIEQQVSQVLRKLQALPLENSLASATAAMESVITTVETAEQTLQSVNSVLDDPSVKTLPSNVEKALIELTAVLNGVAPGSQVYIELNNALDELSEALRNTRALSATLEAEPTRLLFPSEVDRDLIPKGNEN
jgi:paraquat-inducible protein B